MNLELTAAERVDLVNVAELLHGTLDTTTDDGVRIERLRGWESHGVMYVDPNNDSEPIREMTAAAYAAEFYKVCGNSLDEANFDELMIRLEYAGFVLSSLSMGMSIEPIRGLAGSETVTAAIPISQWPTDNRMHMWGL